MTATFTNAPGTRAVDTVRVEIDDKDCTPETDAMLSDEEIQYFIDGNHHILLAAAAAADAVAAKYSGDPKKKKVGDLEIDYGDGRAAAYTARAASLRQRAYKTAASGVYAGGISSTDKDSQEADTDRIQPVFAMGQDDNPASGGTDSDRGIIDY